MYKTKLKTDTYTLYHSCLYTSIMLLLLWVPDEYIYIYIYIYINSLIYMSVCLSFILIYLRIHTYIHTYIH